MSFFSKKLLFGIISIFLIEAININSAQALYISKYAEISNINNYTKIASILDKPRNYKFLPNESNWDFQNMHPEAFSGQNWETDNWNKEWTPKIASDNFFKSGVFTKRYLKSYKKTMRIVRRYRKHFFAIKKTKKYIPVLELGPVFYKLSNLDKNRSLKIVTASSGILNKDYDLVLLVDWKTKSIMGTYSDKGMFLN